MWTIAQRRDSRRSLVWTRDLLAAPSSIANSLNGTRRWAAGCARAAGEAALERVIADIRTNGYWRYKADQSLWDWDEFAKLTLDERKAILIDSLDANHLYVNYGDIADPAYKVSAEDIAVNTAFYEGG